jgi:3-oxoacyl-[acyl-carrier protein] reductase
VDPFFMLGVYGVTKAGLNNLVKSLSVEFMEDNIRVIGVAPGFVDTEMAADFIKGNDKVNDKNCAKPEDMAAIIVGLSSEEMKFMNGETYLAHGGFPRL